MQNHEMSKFEFILTLENNIVIQRFFNVNSYNPASKNSIDLYDVITNICDDISTDLKNKTLDYMNEYPEYIIDSDSSDDNPNTKDEHFLLRIKLGDDIFISRSFPAHIYYPKVRYSVDIRPKIREILGEITCVLSSKNPNKSYLQYELK